MRPGYTIRVKAKHQLRGTDGMGTRIIGRPLMTIEEFINENRSPLS